MVRFAANLTLLFTELPFEQRFAAARHAGFEGVEFLYPYDIPVADFRWGLEASGLHFVLMNTPAPDWAGGPRGYAAQPGNETRFRRDFERALTIAQGLGSLHIQIMPGVAEGRAARKTFVTNLIWAATRAPGASLLIEPQNRHDRPGYFLDDFDLAADILAEVGADNLGLQFDAYHAQMIHQDALGTWEKHGHLARHIQIAGCPGRHEPRIGAIDYPQFFRAVANSGYQGWIGAEYLPQTTTEAGLRWLRERPARAG